MASLTALVADLDATLDIASIPDYPGALNGLQLANAGDVQRLATAVDFSTETVHGAIEAGAQLLLVHHGMFWGGTQAIVGFRHRRLSALITHDIAVYSAHLPLDVHRTYGNNALLAARLELTPSGTFARFQTLDVGLTGTSDVATQRLVDRAAALAAEYRGTFAVTPFDSNHTTRRWGICTGAGASSSTLAEASRLGLDTLVVGEGPHHTAVEARERGIVVIYAGHYATETLGIRALGDAMAVKHGLSATFIDVPSGL